MLSTATPFPNVGSYAKLKGVRGRVRIQQIKRDGSRLVTGKNLPGGRTVSLEDLTAAKAPRT